MIVKSMSRKVPSFGQLIGYIDRDEGQEGYRIRHNVWGRNPDLIRAEFEQNGELLAKRKNGVYLYHEIISITRAKGLSPDEQMARLHDIAENYIAARCPDNLVFGGLHQDKDHSYHYHLMISAKGEVFAETSGYMQSKGFKVIAINPDTQAILVSANRHPALLETTPYFVHRRYSKIPRRFGAARITGAVQSSRVKRIALS